MKVKFCGMRRAADIEYANEYRPDYVGFILSDGFKRSIDFGTFYELNTYLDKDIKRAGVFVNEPLENILRCAYNENLDVIQLHGDENREYIKKLRENFFGEIWKAVRVKNADDIENADRLGADMLLLDSFVPDSYGGTGVTADLNSIRKARFKTPFFIAGGLNCTNVKQIVEDIRPDGVDVSGGIETDGFKNKDKIKKFMEIVRSV